ncbi:hypothetical protein COT97_04960 [Candidatus Falkowbacteria bacterium CG10_big_fil_rev_8_21_14_0_10_39_11]|uniref:Uncharacterized protein n=1 Tax=Candidatus Falkowbacteria bacterium CG10_big_fil_rev_8_21_14_0_10_39_11 TaxID=1974565 RepID=A0A2H0V3S5_9BACT|nr:MAG: hypothetical protein COT97_04960 [Candidatus Falkowbacteria bacterium CG10_big_fil_rev_8_21_14_0_10_39_11]
MKQLTDQQIRRRLFWGKGSIHDITWYFEDLKQLHLAKKELSKTVQFVAEKYIEGRSLDSEYDTTRIHQLARSLNANAYNILARKKYKNSDCEIFTRTTTITGCEGEPEEIKIEDCRETIWHHFEIRLTLYFVPEWYNDDLAEKIRFRQISKLRLWKRVLENFAGWKFKRKTIHAALKNLSTKLFELGDPEEVRQRSIESLTEEETNLLSAINNSPQTLSNSTLQQIENIKRRRHRLKNNITDPETKTAIMGAGESLARAEKVYRFRLAANNNQREAVDVLYEVEIDDRVMTIRVGGQVYSIKKPYFIGMFECPNDDKIIETIRAQARPYKANAFSRVYNQSLNTVVIKLFFIQERFLADLVEYNQNRHRERLLFRKKTLLDNVREGRVTDVQKVKKELTEINHELSLLIGT